MDVEQAQTKQRYRGKLYALSEESAWEDTGTGYVSIVRGGDSRRLVFRDEETGEVLHDRPIFGRDTYQLQGEGERRTIIVWEDPDSQKDWALSFQDPDGTAEVWDAIREEPAAQDEKSILPLPKFGNLEELSRMLTCVPPSQREALAAECMAPKFVSGLRTAFHTAEDLGSEEALGCLWQITKGIFLLSNQRLTERYLKHDVYDDVMGMLEYDEGLPVDKRIAHRQVLKVKVNFQHVLSIEDTETLERIHLNYRLQYLKDLVLPRLLDDTAFVSLTQMIHVNISIILDHLQKNVALLEQLFVQIQQNDSQALLFLQDACRMATKIPQTERQALYERMIERKLFEVLLPYVSDSSGHTDGEEKTLGPPRHLAVEILLLATSSDPSHLRRFLTAEGNAHGRALLAGLIRVMHMEVDQGVQGQIAEVLKSVMDPTALENRERDSSLDVFYERGAFEELVFPLREDVGIPTAAFCFAQQIVCELLAFAVAHHGYRARVFVMRHGIAQQVARLMASPQRFLQLAPVRLMRAMVMTKDDAYHRYIIKSGLFVPVMKNLQSSLAPPALGGNLLVSATLELMEFIRVQNIKVLVDHICKKHCALLQAHAPKLKAFENFLLKHQHNLEYEAFPPEQYAAGGPIVREGHGGVGGGRQRSPGRGDSDDDEAYFESCDDDDEETDGVSGGPAPGSATIASPAKDEPLAGQDGNSSPGLKGLLGGYEDDDEDEENEGCKESKANEFRKSSGGGEATAPPAAADADTTGEPLISGDVVASVADGDAAVEVEVEAQSEADRAERAQAEEKGKAEGASAENEPSAQEEPHDAKGQDCSGVVVDGEERGLSANAKAAAGRGEAPGVGGGDVGGGGAGGAGVVSEKALNHVPKRLKTSAASA
mmetsp:Transcript_115777/g.327457  ORF Transcript_115777/g.327457 Transcript_115777/m.327457 type:complete len:884 (-) Transcript_115777:133-2784(-)